jgi:hypothetical protein
MAELPPELAPPGGTQPGQPQVQDNLRSQLNPMVQDPVDQFVVELMSIADDLGVLDDAFGEESVEDQADLQDADADPFELLSREQLTRLVTLFLQIPEPQRSQIANTLRQELPPQVAQRLEGIVRFVQGRDAQQEIRAQ